MDDPWIKEASRRHELLKKYNSQLMSECFFRAWKKVFGREFGENLDKNKETCYTSRRSSEKDKK